MIVPLISIAVTVAVAVATFCFWQAKIPKTIEMDGVKSVGVVERVLMYEDGFSTSYTPIVRYAYGGREYVCEAYECEGILWPGTKGKEVAITIDPKDPTRIYAKVSSEGSSRYALWLAAGIGSLAVFCGTVGLIHQVLWLMR